MLQDWTPRGSVAEGAGKRALRGVRPQRLRRLRARS